MWHSLHTLGFIGPFGGSRQRGPNLLVDGDMEAVGVTAWTIYNATISKRGDAYEGAQCIRIVIGALGGLGLIVQANLTIGKKYYVTGVARANGTAYPDVRNATSTLVWEGTTSTGWQLFDFTVTSDSTGFRFRANGDAGDYVEFDNLYISEVV